MHGETKSLTEIYIMGKVGNSLQKSISKIEANIIDETILTNIDRKVLSSTDKEQHIVTISSNDNETILTNKDGKFLSTTDKEQNHVVISPNDKETNENKEILQTDE